MATCAVKFCENTYYKAKKNEQKLPFLRIPIQTESIWTKVLPLDSIDANTRICADHLTEHDFYGENKQTLKPGALPTLNISSTRGTSLLRSEEHNV